MTSELNVNVRMGSVEMARFNRGSFPLHRLLCALLFPIKTLFLMCYHSAVTSQWLLCWLHTGQKYLKQSI